MGIGKKCENCNLEASYNWNGATIRKFCKTHKLVGMVNIVSKECVYDKCNKLAIYNYRGYNGLGKYCKNHKLNNMINVANLQYCVKCSKRASFNFSNKKTPMYCVEHKLLDMVDVISKKCLKCDKRPIFNYKNEKKAILCKEHKLLNMVDIKNIHCLICNTRASFNFKNEKPMFCFKHKKNKMINVTKK